MKNSNIPVWHILKEPHLRCGMEFQNLLCLLLFSALWKNYYTALFKKFHRIVFSLYFSKGKIHISFLDFRILAFSVMCPYRHLKLGGHFDFSFWTKTNPMCNDPPKRWFYRPHSGFLWLQKPSRRLIQAVWQDPTYDWRCYTSIDFDSKSKQD